MADRIAITGDEPFEEWIKRNDTPQRLYRTYHTKWPDNTTRCAAIGNEFYIRLHNGGMRLVKYASEFDDKDEWCAQCGTPIDPDDNDRHHCDAFGCDAQLCDDCATNTPYCPQHRGTLPDAKEDEYTYPYTSGNGRQFTYGIEIEIESKLSDRFVENVTDSDIIAGWNHDPSLDQNGVELHTDILTMAKLPALRQIVKNIPEYGDNAGGHIHVARTPNQTANRWYWALRGLDGTQCERLNMRHMDDDYWCSLNHGEYTGKHTAVNDEHHDTIELRTFDCWYEGNADKLAPAVKWVRAMWRFFEKHPHGTVTATTIEKYSSCMADNVAATPRRTLDERLADTRRAHERERQEHADMIRRHVIANVNASRNARHSHGDTHTAMQEWRHHKRRRNRGRKRVEEHMTTPELGYAFPSHNLRPLHRYVQTAMTNIMAGRSYNSLRYFLLYHAYSDDSIWNGYEYLNRHGDMAERAVENIIRSRIARASHGKPTAEPLERVALRSLKRAGRSELCERYVRARKYADAVRVAD